MAIGSVNTGGGGSGGILTVTAPAGVTVSVSKDGKTKRKTANAEGLAIFKGLATGTWALTITDGVQTSTKPIVITADYSTVIAFFMATIAITYPAGSSCTCSDGVTTLTAPDTSGVWNCIVPNTGTWTVSCTDGTESTEEVVVITADGQSEVLAMSYWDGKTLYDAGNEYVNITGGFVAKPMKYSNSYATVKEPVIERGDGYFKATQTDSGTGGAVVFDKKINMTAYSKLHFTGELYRSGAQDGTGFYVWSELGATKDDNRVAVTHAGTDTTLKDGYVDVSSLSGEYYVGFFLYHENSYINITKLYGE